MATELPTEPFVITETWEGDGTGGAAFLLPDETVVFVSEWTDRGQPREMTSRAFGHAERIRDAIKPVYSEWSRDVPRAPGYYWWRCPPATSCKLVFVSSDSKFLDIGGSVLTPCSAVGGEWHGPVRHP